MREPWWGWPSCRTAPDLWERFRAWVFGGFGVPGLIILACASAALFAWTQWDKVSTWPGVHAMVELVSRAPVPKADPERFSVLVAKLNHDDVNDTLGNQIYEILKEFSGIQALPLDRTLARDFWMTEAMDAEAGEVARRVVLWLRQRRDAGAGARNGWLAGDSALCGIRASSMQKGHLCAAQ